MGTGSGAELVVDLLDVRSDDPGAEHQLGANLPQAETVREQGEHLALPLAQRALTGSQ